MAISAATVASDFNAAFLPAHQAAPIFERAQQMSVVQRLVQQIPLAANGETVPVVTGAPAAGWVSEGGIKPATSGSLDIKTMTPKKLAAILVVSAEVVRANPGNYVQLMRGRLASTFARAFDRAALHDEGPDGTAGAGPFATYLDQTTKGQEVGGSSQANGGIHGDLVEAMREIVTDADASGTPYRLNGWAIDARLEPSLWGATDTTGRPLYTELPNNADSDGLSTEGRLLGRRSFIGEGVATSNGTSVVGYGGDWSQAAWGVVGGISFRVSTEAAVTINGSLQSAFERNLFVLLAEAEYGFLLNDANAFVKLTNNSGS